MDRARRITKGEVRRTVERIAAGYEAIVRRLSQLPRTIIHGEFYPSNILVTGSEQAPAIHPVDWEMSALAPGLMDLAALSAGWAEAEREALAATYWAARTRGVPIGDDTFRQLRVDLDCCRVHLALTMLGW